MGWGGGGGVFKIKLGSLSEGIAMVIKDVCSGIQGTPIGNKSTHEEKTIYYNSGLERPTGWLRP